MLREIERIRSAFDDAVSLDLSGPTLCTYNYKSGALALQQLGNFANALSDASLRLRSGRPYVANELKPRSTAKAKQTSRDVALEISSEINHRRGAKKAKKKSP